MDQPLMHKDRLANSVRASFSFLITGSLPFMTDGYLWTWISPVIPVLKITFNETYMTRYGRALPQPMWSHMLLPLITSSALLGGLFGGFTTKFWLRFCSRKSLMQISCIVIVASVFMTSIFGKLTLSYEAFIIGRFFTGAACGVCYNVAPMILAEMSTWHQQGYYQSISAVSMSLGSVCGPVFAHHKVLIMDQPLMHKDRLTRYGKPLPQSMWNHMLLPLITSSALLGGSLGGFPNKFWLRFCSRKLLMQISCIVIIASILVTSIFGKLTLSYEAFIIGRFFTGAACGICYNLAPMILAEMSTWHQQAYYQSISAVSMSFGSVCGPVFAQPKVFGTYQLWPCMISITALPSIVYLISSIWIPNSPYYIYRTKGREFALIELAKLRRGSQTDLSEELDKIEAEIQKGEAVGIVEMLTTKQFRNQLFAVIVIAANLVLTGIDNIMLYANQIFVQAGVDPKYATFATIGVFVLQFIVGLFGVKIIDIFGARKVNISSGIITVIAYTLYTISQATLHLYPSVMPYLAIIGVGMFLTAWSGGICPATIVFFGELTIERTRATALGYASIFLWSFAWLVGFVPPYLHEYLGAYSMTPWLGFAFVFVVYQIVYLPETKDRSSEEIQSKFT